MMDLSLISYLCLAAAIALVGTALVIHVRQEAKDAHGKKRKFL